MDFKVGVEFSPGDLAAAVQETTKEFMRLLAAGMPDEMRSEMRQFPPASSEGNAPAKRTGELAGSFEANDLTIVMAGHAQYLDPVFNGHLNRPFIMPAVARRLAELI
ncbi:MAG TPA: hypothetical protein VGD05_14105 [Pyrinomonadaceae bacterium]|jgi:hypothetical protein